MTKTPAAFALWIVVVGIHSTVPAFAQSAGGPTFEVVAIKRNTSQIGPGFRSNVVTWRPDGALTMTNVIVSNIMTRAYPSTVPVNIVGLPDWARRERFDVSATSSLSRATPDDRIAMLRAMLADRFKLVLHVEKREQPTYDLVLARADGRLGPGLKPVETDCARIVAERTAAAEAAPAASAPPPRPDLSVPPPPCTFRAMDPLDERSLHLQRRAGAAGAEAGGVACRRGYAGDRSAGAAKRELIAGSNYFSLNTVSIARPAASSSGAASGRIAAVSLRAMT